MSDDPAHGDLLALDPSVNSPGVALFRFGILQAAGRIKVPKDWAELTAALRWMRVAGQIFTWWQEQREGGREVLRSIVFECPKIYKNSKSKGDANQLLGLVGVGASFCTMMHGYNVAAEVRPPELSNPLPSEWIGQLPKTTTGDAWKSPRGGLIKSMLKPGEITIAGVGQHDKLDAIGLGLWRLGRLHATRRVFSGAV